MKNLLFALMLLGLTQSAVAADFIRKYGEATTINFKLYKPDGTKFVAGTDAVCANTASPNDSDVRIMKDEGDESDLDGATCFVDEGQTYSVALTATEMTAKRIVVIIIDQTATQTWLDTSFVIETYGNASAQYPDEIVTANVTQIDGSATTSMAELSAAPGTSPSLTEMVKFIYQWLRNKKETTDSGTTLYKNNGSTGLVESTDSDDGTTFTRGRLE